MTNCVFICTSVAMIIEEAWPALEFSNVKNVHESYSACENSDTITITKQLTFRLIVYPKITKRKGEKNTPASCNHALQAMLV